MAAFYSNVKEVTIRSVFPPETVYKTLILLYMSIFYMFLAVVKVITKMIRNGINLRKLGVEIWII